MNNIIRDVLEHVQNDKEYLQQLINELQDICNNRVEDEEEEESIPLF